ncbi:MAG TPA: hypothetical protein ENI89_01970 [Desulfobulbus sp.]|nr:hypothetical protein [Desulfobulbus sp.]
MRTDHAPGPLARDHRPIRPAAATCNHGLPRLHRFRRKTWGVLVFLATLFWAGSGWTQLQWQFHGRVAEGGQLDVQATDDGTIHLVSSRYYQFDRQGRLLIEEPVGDTRQGGMDFPPAIAVDPTGTAHLLTRHDGSWSSGFELRYRRRNQAGAWDRDITVGQPLPRNYVLGIAAAGPDDVIMQTSRQVTNVWGNHDIWQIRGSRAVRQGELTGIWRADTDARMRTGGDRIFLVSGRCDGDGTVYFTHCRTGSDCRSQMEANLRAHRAGSGRRGMPDIAVDGLGQGHLTYGAFQEVYYNRYDERQRPVFAEDRRIFSGLGTWHLSIGLSAVAASADGNHVMAVALRSDGSKEAGNAEILWSWSADGGESWSAPRSLGIRTDAGEGRRRPRLVAVGSTFYLFYADREIPGISMASIDMEQYQESSPITGALHLLLDG